MAAMITVFDHLTVPVDGSATSDRGVAFALELAGPAGRVTFCSVVDPTLVCIPAAAGATIDPGPMLAVLDEDAAAFCARAAGAAAARGIAADTCVMHGTCVDQIESLVRRNGSDAIVIGTHGRTGVALGVLGSVAEDLMCRSDVPVVAVHADDVMRTGPVMVALDASPAASAALDTAIRIAAALSAPLALAHAFNGPAEDQSAVRDLLGDAATRARANGVEARRYPRTGRPGDAVVSAADEIEACMIVMGTHGRRSFERLVLGSVAAHVVEHARVPVVTVRRSAHA